MKWWFLWWLLLSLLFHKKSDSLDSCKEEDSGSNEDENQGSFPKCGLSEMISNKRPTVSDAKSCMEEVNSILSSGNGLDSTETIECLEQILEETQVNETVCMSFPHLVAVLLKPKCPFEGVEIHASDTEAALDQSVTNSKVNVRLPRELYAGTDNTIVFCMITWLQTNRTIFGAPGVLYENRLVGLSVRSKNISGLQERVTITMALSMDKNETKSPKCVFYDFSRKEYYSEGCLTLWDCGQSHITCSCDHLTYFGVLLVPADISPEDQEILKHISLIGCSLSVFALVITIFLFIVNRKVRADVAMKIHINLAVALILLNIHFMPSKAVADVSSTALCFYVAVSLHYSLLASFSWMALEGFHIYLLLVRVFNIYVKRYLLKLAVVGWGVPAVIVSLVMIIDRDAYGHVSVDSSNPNSTMICYITDDTVKLVTTVGVFALVFTFNVILFGVTVRRVLSSHPTNESDSARVKREISTVMGVVTLLGITWGLIFFSFGHLTTPGLYIFCILSSLQGFFIFLWFVMSLKKNRDSATKTSKETHTTNT
ncbi:adhesion G-protein coupled receptor G1-like isoform X1 [Seriola aureovittata]|uniref:adhesion G-protein coupled receptor G1-like isoform X1 n=1 Tax=Seriola aureovittata TaxID=2871759 RepID=UPI0024BEC4BF|nr:adhesion G-protein coupled receptor G1-like isoform X1 [Seriola aureovittata]